MAEQKYEALVFQGQCAKDYNDFIASKREEINKFQFYIFLRRDVLSISDDLVNTYGKYMNSFPNEVVGAVYGDGFIVTDVTSHYILPQASRYLFDIAVINPPVIAVNSQIVSRIFNEKLDHLYFYDALKKIYATSCVVHIPEFCYNFLPEPFDMNEEISKI